jgi:uncharacterized protein YceH (UPF0502 family)
LPREPGSRELRYVHLLSPVPEPVSGTTTEHSHRRNSSPDSTHDGATERIATLESEVRQLRERIASLEEKLAQLIG